MRKEDNMNTASGLRITMILLGIAVTPVLLSSSSLGNQLSSGSLISVVLLGGVILTLLSAITISVGEKARLPTYGIVKYSFGEKGAIAINILMAISLFGWIAVTANMFGHSVHDLLAQNGIEAPLALLVAAGCVIFCRLYGLWFFHSGQSCPGRRAGYRTGAVLYTLCGNPYRSISASSDSGDEYRCRRFHRCWHYYCAGCYTSRLR